MGKNGDTGQGVLFLWGEDGLQTVTETASGAGTEKKSDSLGKKNDCPDLSWNFSDETQGIEKPLSFETFRRLSDESDGERRIRAGEGDWDCCNDPEEYIRESEQRKTQKRARQEARGTSAKIRQRPSILARAADALSRRDYSRKELRVKLMRNLSDGENSEDVEKALERLEEWGYLSDTRFAENRARIKASSLGNARIRRELRLSGVDDEKVQAAIETIEEPEDVRAYRVWARRYKEIPGDRKERDRQIRYLLYRGFSMDSINRVLRGRVELPDESNFYWR